MTTQALEKNKFAINREWYVPVIEKMKTKQWPVGFEAKPTPWFPTISERCIEIPWALSRYAGQKNVLEIGLALADMTLVSAQLEMKKISGCKLTALDIVDIERTRSRFFNIEDNITDLFEFHQGDVRKAPLPSDTYDLIFIISTLEHIGFDEFEPNAQAGTVFKRPKDMPQQTPKYNNDDQKVLAELKRLLKPGGSVLLTVPMGSGGFTPTQDSKGLYWFYKEYSAADWKKLIAESGLTPVEQRFFRDGGKDGWIEEDAPEKVDKETGRMLPQAKGVACVELKKK